MVVFAQSVLLVILVMLSYWCGPVFCLVQPAFSPLEGTKITVNNLHPRVTEEDIVVRKSHHLPPAFSHDYSLMCCSVVMTVCECVAHLFAGAILCVRCLEASTIGKGGRS